MLCMREQYTGLGSNCPLTQMFSDHVTPFLFAYTVCLFNLATWIHSATLSTEAGRGREFT